MSKYRFSIVPWFNTNTNSWGYRATHFGPFGTSTQTCMTRAEAEGFITICDNRRPRGPNGEYRTQNETERSS